MAFTAGTYCMLFSVTLGGVTLFGARVVSIVYRKSYIQVPYVSTVGAG